MRAAGPLNTAGKVVTAYVSPVEAASLKVGQRARTFPVESRSSMFQARVSAVAAEGRRVRVEVTLTATGRKNTTLYLVEIIADHGEFLSVPNEAIIEEGGSQVVYVQREAGRYEPQVVTTGIQGELYTQVLEGVREGEQVVTFGSFFIDSEYKLKGAARSAP